MSTYLDDQDVDGRVVYLEGLLQRFIELFAEDDGVPVLDADPDDVIDLLDIAAGYLAETEVVE